MVKERPIVRMPKEYENLLLDKDLQREKVKAEIRLSLICAQEEIKGLTQQEFWNIVELIAAEEGKMV